MAEEDGHVATESPRQRSELQRSARRAAASRKPLDDDDTFANFDEQDIPGALQEYLIDARLQDAVSALTKYLHCLRLSFCISSLSDQKRFP